MAHPYLLIVSIMVVAGIAGGFLNHSLGKRDESVEKGAWQSLLAGVVASFMVPLFLNTISSNLMDSIIGTSANPGNPSKLFIFAGFCLVAAVTSKAFITNLSTKVLSEVKAAREEVKQIRGEVEPIIEKETEKNPSEIKALSVSVAESMHLEENAQRVLRALADGKFVLRTRTGIAADARIEKETVNKIVEELKTEGLVGSVKILRGDEPKTRWYITPEGRSALASLGSKSE